MAASWRLAESLVVLRKEVNSRWPGRDKASDGTIGDISHQGRDSDHNPWIKEHGKGVVSAMDITEDRAADTPEIADEIVRILLRRRDPRVKYIIHEARIWRSYPKAHIKAWKPAEYTGPNLHTRHVHISVLPQRRFYDDRAIWGLLDPHAPRPTPMHRPVNAVKPETGTLGKGDDGQAVRRLQHGMNVVFPAYSDLVEDGDYGEITASVIREFQTRVEHRVTGNVDVTTRRKLTTFGVHF